MKKNKYLQDAKDKKVDALENALRYERNVNKMIMKFLKDKFGSEFIERVESNC